MSTRNERKDRDFNGKIKAKYRGKQHPLTWHTPSWWTTLWMHRPKRRRNKAVCAAIQKGIDPDSLVAPLGNKKPHIYYW